MKAMKLSVAILSALALAAPGTSSFAKDKGKNKDKDKGGKAQSEQTDNRGTPHHDGDGDGKVTICHVPGGDRSKQHTISVGEAAWSAHKGHGDYRGACNANAPTPGNGRFDDLDRNDDGVISRGEWTGSEDSFDRLDRNDDGVISRREFGR